MMRAEEMNLIARKLIIALACSGIVTVGCGAAPEEGSGGSDSETETETETETDTDGTTGDPTTTTGAPTTEGPSGTETMGTSGNTTDETTDDPTTEDPTTEDPTTEDPTTEDPTTEDPTTEDPTTEDPTDTDPTTEDPTTEDPTTGGNACDELIVEEIGAEDAILTGDWDLIMSMQMAEGMVAVWPMGAEEGTVTWEYDAPCADSWHVWVRMFDQGEFDSSFVLVDGAPDGWAVTEVDCSDNGQNYRWGELNWRDPQADVCDYVEDPWFQDWDAGVHEVTFAYRESPAISRLIFTNDPNFTP